MKSLDLDTTRQRELYQSAEARVAELLPGWSDEIPSDPAVAILELVSYLSDIQNFALDRVGEAHYLAYLKLLGETPRPLTPARLLARPLTDGAVLPGMDFWIGGVPFEVTEDRRERADPGAETAPITLEQRRTRSRWAELSPPFALPEGWAEEPAPRFFLPEGEGWRERGELRVEQGRVTGWRGEAPAAVRVVAAQADFSALHTLRGVAAQRVRLDETGVLPRSLALMVEEDGLWYDCPVGRPEENRTGIRGCRWDGGAGALCFGDGRDFRVPRPGQLLVTGCACCLGSAGNGAGGVLERDGVRLRSIGPASGGQDEERAEDAFRRVAAEQDEPLRAVTCGDYERLARRAPGLALDRVRAVTNRALGRPGAGVTVVAKPRSEEARPALTVGQEARLRRWLEPFRLLGVPLTVKGPRYCRLSARVRIQADETLDRQRLHAVALSLTDGVTGPLEFGGVVSCSALFSALGAVRGVRRVRQLELEPLSPGGRRDREGNVRLEVDALSCLERLEVTEE